MQAIRIAEGIVTALCLVVMIVYWVKESKEIDHFRRIELQLEALIFLGLAILNVVCIGLTK